MVMEEKIIGLTTKNQKPRGFWFKEREKLKYFEGVLRSLWELRSVSYEIY